MSEPSDRVPQRAPDGLLPCPFCGTAPTCKDDGDELAIMCGNDKCRLVVGVPITTKERAIAHWNSRAVEKAGKPDHEFITGYFTEQFEKKANERATPSGADMRAALEEARVYLLKYTAGFALKERALLAKIDAALLRPQADVRAALEPFARVAEHDIGESEHDDDLFRPMRNNNHAPLLTVGDFRRALAALTRPDGDQS